MRKFTLLFLILAALVTACAATGPLTVSPARTGAALQAVEGKGRWFIWVDEINDLRGAPRPDWFGELDQRFSAQNAPAYLNPEPKVYLRDNLKRMLLDAGLEASSREAARVILKVELTKFSAARNSAGLADELSVQIDYKVTFSKSTGEVLGTSRVPGVRTMTTPSGDAKDLEEMTREVVKSSLEALAVSESFQSALAAGAQ